MIVSQRRQMLMTNECTVYTVYLAIHSKYVQTIEQSIYVQWKPILQFCDTLLMLNVPIQG